MARLQVRGVSKTYGSVRAVSHVAIQADEGEAIALLGPNGSGKSTLMRLLVTLEPPDRGEIGLDGVSVVKAPAAARRLLGYVGQEMAVDKLLTGREFLRFQAGIVHIPARETESRIDQALERMQLGEAADRRTETYSGGMRRRLDLAASLLHRPALVVLDEPSTGLDLEARQRFWGILETLVREGTTLVVATHDFEEADRLAARVVLMAGGHVVGEGTPAELRGRLGQWVLSASLHESPRPGDHETLEALLGRLGGRLIPAAAGSAEACVALEEPAPAGEAPECLAPPAVHGRLWIEKVEALASEASLELFSVTIRRPTLQDVYRAAVASVTATDAASSLRASAPPCEPSSSSHPISESATDSASDRRPMSDFWRETHAQTSRWFLHTLRRPMVVASGLFQPVIWLTLFALLFRNSPMAALGGRTGYLGFIAPGALMFTALNAALNAGIPVLFDRELGFLDRLRVAPLVDRFSIVLSSALHIACMTLLQCLVILVGMSLLGVSFQGGLSGWFLLGAVLVMVTVGFTAISLALAFVFKQHFEMIALVMLVTLPLIFLSSAFAPLDYLPVWLRHLVLLNPVTLGTELLRMATLNVDWSLSSPVLPESILGVIRAGHCLAGLVLFCVLAILWNRRVLARRLR